MTIGPPDIFTSLKFRARAHRGFCFLSLLIILFLSVPLASGGTYCEDFNNNRFNENYFDLFTVGTGPSAAVTNNRLEITIPANSSGDLLAAVLGCKVALSGDFEVQVDFNLLSWPAANGIRVGIDSDFPSSVHRASFGPADGGNWEGYYLWINSQMAKISSTDTSGKLRMTRQGNTIEGFYWQNNAWQSIGSFSDPAYGEDMGVNISVNSGTPSHFSGSTVQAAFDNFRITNKNISNGPTFLPLLMD